MSELRVSGAEKSTKGGRFGGIKVSLYFLSQLVRPHSMMGAGSSNDTRLLSRKSGCLRSWRNLMGVNMWVEPVREERGADKGLTRIGKSEGKGRREGTVEEITHIEDYGWQEGDEAASWTWERDGSPEEEKSRWRDCERKKVWRRLSAQEDAERKVSLELECRTKDEQGQRRTTSKK